MADLVGIYLVMSRVSGKGSVKVLIAGLGWAFAELVLTRLVAGVLAVQNSSIGDLVTDSLTDSLTQSVTFTFYRTQVSLVRSMGSSLSNKLSHLCKLN